MFMSYEKWVHREKYPNNTHLLKKTSMLALVGEIATPFDPSSMKDFMGKFKNLSSPNIQD